MKKNIWVIYDPENDIIDTNYRVDASRDSARKLMREWKEKKFSSKKSKVCKATLTFNEKQKGC